MCYAPPPPMMGNVSESQPRWCPIEFCLGLPSQQAAMSRTSVLKNTCDVREGFAYRLHRMSVCSIVAQWPWPNQDSHWSLVHGSLRFQHRIHLSTASIFLSDYKVLVYINDESPKSSRSHQFHQFHCHFQISNLFCHLFPPMSFSLVVSTRLRLSKWITSPKYWGSELLGWKNGESK